jgi:hypothetical protein
VLPAAAREEEQCAAHRVASELLAYDAGEAIE